MTPIAPHISAFLSEWLPRQRGASPHTCESYSLLRREQFEVQERSLSRDRRGAISEHHPEQRETKLTR